MNVEISVIVPIYKVEKYIKRCVDSILGQTFKNIEIILVDDGSPDKCPEICDDYKVKDQRIRVIHQENMGLSAARNSGIEIAKGKYLVFIDSDDYIAKDMLEYLLEGTTKYNADVVCCGYTAVYDNGKEEKITIPKEDKVYSKEDALNILLSNGYIDVVAWNKLYKRELFLDIRYPKGKLYEDMLTTYKIIDKANTILLRPDTKYFYCKRSDSIGGNGFSKKTLSLIDACDEVFDFVKNNYKITPKLEIAKIQWYIVVLNKMILANDIDKYFVKEIKRMIFGNLINIIKSNELNRIRKIQLIILMINSGLYKVCYKKFLKDNR